jgi:hypothetical protein
MVSVLTLGDGIFLTAGLLRIFSNEIGIGGGEAMAALLMKGSALTQLDMASNKMGDDGAFAFGAALKRNDTLLRFVAISVRLLARSMASHLVRFDPLAAVWTSAKTRSVTKGWLLFRGAWKSTQL